MTKIIFIESDKTLIIMNSKKFGKKVFIIF